MRPGGDPHRPAINMNLRSCSMDGSWGSASHQLDTNCLFYLPPGGICNTNLKGLKQGGCKSNKSDFEPQITACKGQSSVCTGHGGSRLLQPFTNDEKTSTSQGIWP